MNQPSSVLAGLALALFASAPAGADVLPPREASAAGAVTVPLDGEMVLGGVGVACTGIGGTKDDPKWLAYPVRLEFSNAQREYLIGATVTIADAKGADILTATCGGPWLLLKLPDAAAYRVTAKLNDGKTSKPQMVKSPAKGQTRVILVF
jgi:hypothetical protein